MKNQTVQRCVALGLGLLWMVSGGSSARADGVGVRRPIVRISVFNDAGVQGGTVRLAERDASEVFRDAGIETEWRNCGGEDNASEVGAGEVGAPCAEVSFPARLVLRIEKRPHGLVPEVFGVAYLSQDGQGAYCDVFVEPMQELQKLYPVGLDAVLGYVAAHEIAHLLLGRHSHTPSGLMKARWDSRTIEELRRGMLGFNSTQSAVMVERLEFARRNADDGLVTMAGAEPATFSVLPARCPNSH